MMMPRVSRTAKEPAVHPHLFPFPPCLSTYHHHHPAHSPLPPSSLSALVLGIDRWTMRTKRSDRSTVEIRPPLFFKNNNNNKVWIGQSIVMSEAYLYQRVKISKNQKKIQSSQPPNPDVFMYVFTY